MPVFVLGRVSVTVGRVLIVVEGLLPVTVERLDVVETGREELVGRFAGADVLAVV